MTIRAQCIFCGEITSPDRPVCTICDPGGALAGTVTPPGVLAFPKKIRNLESGFLDFVRKQPCVFDNKVEDSPRIACCPWIEADHIITRGAGGDDVFAVSVCALHHRQRDAIGISSIQMLYGVNVWEWNARTQAAYYGRKLAEIEEIVSELQERFKTWAKSERGK